MVVVDEQREAKRRKVIHELHETERTYLEGLELIYSVRTCSLAHPQRCVLTVVRRASIS